MQNLANQLGIKFKDIFLLNRAFTHSSYSNETGKLWPDNERLEYLGDSVLGLITNEYLYKRFENYPEGKLAKIKGRVVSEGALTKISDKLSLSDYLLLGKGEKESGGGSRASNQANLVEALLGAIYLDQGLNTSKKFILNHIKDLVDNLEKIEAIKDYKTILQEYCQKKYRFVPSYELVSETGPDHDKEFRIHVSIKGVVSSEGIGKNKRKAEQNAAKNVLKQLKLIH
ncbi:MAG: ribonuclease III [Leptospiraceae bacterium]|nr:ribonuclease III [Leptospiraceae bacterium]